MQIKAALCAIFMCATALPSAAQEVFFATPSGNIGCFLSGDEGFVRCDIAQMTTQTHSETPADCEFDFGAAFGVSAQSPMGEALCVSDAVMTDDPKVLDYGRSLSGGGITCTSDKAGLRCENEAGHGFDISKARQDLF